MTGMLDRLKARNNEFWDDARQYYLDDFLNAAYASDWKRRLIGRWLAGVSLRRVVFRQMDYPCDPLVIEFLPDGFNIMVRENDLNPDADVEVALTHLAIVPSSTFFRSSTSGTSPGRKVQLVRLSAPARTMRQ